MNGIKLYGLIFILLVLASALVFAVGDEQILNIFTGNQKTNVDATDVLDILNPAEPVQIPISSDVKQRAYEEVEQELAKSDIIPIIVWMKKDASIDQILGKMQNFELKYKYDQFNGFAGSANKKDIAILLEDEGLDYIAFDAVVKAQLIQSRVIIQANVTESGYNLRGNGVGVCVLDTGVRYNHTALVQAYAGGYDFINNDADPFDDHGHGTATAGIIASNSTFFRGVAPNVNLLAVKVLGSTGAGTWSEVIAGINWCVTNKNLYNISVISMSLGSVGTTYTPATNPGYAEPALQVAYNSNIVSVASSGNDGSLTSMTYPAVSPYVVSVGSTYDGDLLGGYVWNSTNFICTDPVTYTDMVSCFGNRASFLDLMAPGSRISTLGLSSNFQSWSGTSMAAPHVSATVALMKQRNPQMTVSQIKNILKSTGNTVFDNATGLTFPRVNALNAVNAVPYLNKTGSIGPNANMTFYLNSKLEPGFTTLFALSLGRIPGIPLPDGRTIPLNIDDLLLLSIQSPATVFLTNSLGSLNSNGVTTTAMNLPYIPGIENVEAYAGFITINNTSGELASVSNAVRL